MRSSNLQKLRENLNKKKQKQKQTKKKQTKQCMLEN